MKDKMNPKYTQIAVYVIVTAIIIWCLGLVANNLGRILHVAGQGFGWIFQVAKPVLLAFVLAYLLTPPVDFFQRKYENLHLGKKSPKKSRRGLAVLTVLLLLIIVLTFIISLLISSITKQVRLASLDDFVLLVNGFATGLNGFYNELMDTLAGLNIESETLQEYIQSAGSYVAGFLRNMGSNLLDSVTNLTNLVTTILFSVVIGIYFLIDGRMLISYWNRVLHAFFSEKWNQHFCQFLQDADEVFSGYIRGQLMDASVMMLLISVVLGLTGVKFAVVIGIFAGIGNLIPYVGPFVAYVSTVLVCLLEGDWKRLLIALILLFIVQTIDGNLIGPRLLSSSIQIHPLLVVISLIFGSAIGGFLGMLVAVPIGALVKVLFNRMIEQRLRHRAAKKEKVPIEETTMQKK